MQKSLVSVLLLTTAFGLPEHLRRRSGSVGRSRSRCKTGNRCGSPNRGRLFPDHYENGSRDRSPDRYGNRDPRPNYDPRPDPPKDRPNGNDNGNGNSKPDDPNGNHDGVVTGTIIHPTTTVETTTTTSVAVPAEPTYTLPENDYESLRKHSTSAALQQDPTPAPSTITILSSSPDTIPPTLFTILLAALI